MDYNTIMLTAGLRGDEQRRRAARAQTARECGPPHKLGTALFGALGEAQPG